MSTPSAGSPGRPIQADDLEVTLAVRRDLGGEQDQAVIGEFLDRVGAAIDQRVDARVRAHGVAPHPPPYFPPHPPPPAQPGPPIALGIILTAFIWAAIADVNVTYTRRR